MVVMKQRIRVVGIIKTEDKILVLKRSRGRAEAPVFWELPTGKIEFGEQPEESISRTLNEYVGVTPLDIQLKDVITFVAPEGASRLYNLYIVYEIAIKDKPRLKGRYTAYKYVSDFSTSGIHLDGASAAVLEIENRATISSHLSYRETASSHTIYIDGASRGNPGPSGIGYLIKDPSGQIIEKGGEFIGFTTARAAEYHAMRKGIERALALGFRTARFISDSQMVVNQLSGITKPKNQDTMPIYDTIKKLLVDFDSVSFTHVPREENQVADAEANLAIDRALNR